MNRITPEELADLRRRYPRDCRVKLLCMNDPHNLDLKASATDTVMHEDDCGMIHVAWDCGSTLGVVYGVDSCTVVRSEGGKRSD